MRQIQTQKEQFEYTDRIVQPYLKKLLRLFDAFSREMGRLSFDELNVLDSRPAKAVQAGNALYESASRLIYEFLLAIVIYYYGRVTGLKPENGLFVGEIDGFDGKKREIDFDPAKFLKEYLEIYNPTTKYLFYPEIDRKKSRLIESVIAAEMPQNTKGLKVAAIAAAVGTALRLLSRQMEQYGDNITFAATYQAYEDAGVPYVQWHTMEDFKVCKACDELDEEIFPIDQVPPPQHYNCRCWVTPVRNKKMKKIKKNP